MKLQIREEVLATILLPITIPMAVYYWLQVVLDDHRRRKAARG